MFSLEITLLHGIKHAVYINEQRKQQDCNLSMGSTFFNKERRRETLLTRRRNYSSIVSKAAYFQSAIHQSMASTDLDAKRDTSTRFNSAEQNGTSMTLVPLRFNKKQLEPLSLCTPNGL